MEKDRFKYFRIEARELVDGLAKGVLDLERNGGGGDITARLLRLAHTLKGAARIVGHGELADLSHRLEDVLAPLRNAPAGQRDQDRLDAAVAIVDQMTTQVTAIQQPPSAQPARVRSKTSPPPTLTAGQPSSPALRLPGEPQPIQPVHAQQLPELRAAAAVEPAEPVAPPVMSALRFDPTAVDDVLRGLGEIHQLVRRLRSVDDIRALTPRIEQLERELREVHQDAERLRLLTAEALFTGLERTARDGARASGKRVAFTASGGDIRVDAQVLNALHGPLVQLVRNAVAHGIERPDARVAAGKPAEGRVAISVALHGSRIAITCHDDGRGIDVEAVRRAAIRRGTPAERAGALDRDQLIALVLQGGLTTSSEVTALSGRGIGLDLVRDAVRSLGGEVTARTGPDGTAITIIAPTQIAAVPALAVSAGGRTAALPLAAVRRVARIAASAVLHGPDGFAIAVDDVTVPFAPLARLLGATGDTVPRSLVLVEVHGALAAIGVDHVLGVDEVVVRALPAGAPIEPIVWAVVQGADGLPRPVLEPAALVAAARALPAATTATEARPQPVLIVDDSLTTRMLEHSILASAGYDVDIAASAEEGLAKLDHRDYGLVLVDVEMPGMDGFGFITQLRARPESADVPAILVSSRNRPDDFQRGVAVGAQGYMVKSEFDQVALLEMIRRLVRR